MKLHWITVTLDRENEHGKRFETRINIGPDGWSQDGDDLGESVDLASAITEAAAEYFETDSE